jgi:hypothetical protein
MKIEMEIWRDKSVVTIMDDDARIIDRYESKDILLKDYHRYDSETYKDPEGTLPAAVMYKQ